MSPPLRARVTYHTAGPQTETPFAAENLSAPLAFASCSDPLHDVQAAGAVDQVHEAAAVVADVVAADAGGAVRNRRDEAGDLGGAWGLLMSTILRPWANQATGISAPRTSSAGWWQQVKSG